MTRLFRGPYINLIAPSLKENLTSVFRVSIIAMVVVSVSGIVPLLVQGYAWIDMARKAGGIEHLAFAMTKAKPCCLCEMAQDLSDSSRTNEKTPNSSKPIEFLKGLGSIASEFRFSLESVVDSNYTFPIPKDALLPAGKSKSPPTPPPQTVATFS